MVVAQSFSYVADSNTRLMVLGSMPGIASLTADAYYAHPRNLFWVFMRELFMIDPEAAYQARLDGLLRRGVGLWDVYHECERHGSLDSAIQQQGASVNDFMHLFERFPAISVLAFNGQAAHKAFLKHTARDARLSICLKEKKLLSLPSTSPANAAISFEEKLRRWQAINTQLNV